VTGAELLTLASSVVALAGVVLMFVTNRRANATSEKKVDIEAEQSVAEMRLSEIKRLDDLVRSLRLDVDKLTKTVEELQRRDRDKQRTINDQADELERTNEVLSDVRELFTRFVARVEIAWTSGHTMPTLTADERELLERTLPRRIRTTKGASP
jgi:chromosome segregation ATPase